MAGGAGEASLKYGGCVGGEVALVPYTDFLSCSKNLQYSESVMRI